MSANEGMSDDALIRRTNLAKIKAARNLTNKELAELGKCAPNRLSELLSGSKRSFGEKTARAFEAGLQLPRGWLDQIHDGTEPPLQLAYTPQSPTFTPEAMEIAAQFDELTAPKARARAFAGCMKAIVAETQGGQKPAPVEAQSGPPTAPLLPGPKSKAE